MPRAGWKRSLPPDRPAEARSLMAGPIVAIGGAEFTMRPENEALHDYVLSLTDTVGRPRICLLPTASGDPNDQIVAFHGAMERRGCEVSAISLFRLGVSPIDFAEHLLAQDVIYVTGGSMVNLLALWREHRIGEIMRAAHERGIVLCGYSAGSMCWFEHGVSRGGGAPAPVPGLGLLRGSNCVHYSQDPAAPGRLPPLRRRRHDPRRDRPRRPRCRADPARQARRSRVLARERDGLPGRRRRVRRRRGDADRNPPAATGPDPRRTRSGRDARAPPRPLGAHRSRPLRPPLSEGPTPGRRAGPPPPPRRPRPRRARAARARAPPGAPAPLGAPVPPAPPPRERARPRPPARAPPP